MPLTDFASLPLNFVDEEKIKLFQNKIVLFLTCFAVSQDLKKLNLLGKNYDADFFEEISLKCLYKSLAASNTASLSDATKWKLLYVDEQYNEAFIIFLKIEN